MIKSLESSVKWFGTLEEAKAYISTEVNADGYRHNDGDWRRFGEQVDDFKE